MIAYDSMKINLDLSVLSNLAFQYFHYISNNESTTNNMQLFIQSLVSKLKWCFKKKILVA
jgi:hypothetical protein